MRVSPQARVHVLPFLPKLCPYPNTERETPPALIRTSHAPVNAEERDREREHKYEKHLRRMAVSVVGPLVVPQGGINIETP